MGDPTAGTGFRRSRGGCTHGGLPHGRRAGSIRRRFDRALPAEDGRGRHRPRRTRAADRLDSAHTRDPPAVTGPDCQGVHAMSIDYPAAIRPRSALRRVVDTVSGYVRIDLVEERMFPLSSILRYVAVIFPVLLYYFQSSFLHLGPDQFAFMLIGTSLTAGLQDALTGLTSRLQFAQERGTLETYLVEPVPWALIPVAMNIWRSFTGGAVACLMVTVGWLLGAPMKASAVPLALLVLFLGVAACNAVGSL